MTENNNDDKDEIEALAKRLAISCQKHHYALKNKTPCAFWRGGECPIHRLTNYGCDPVDFTDWLLFFERLEKHAKEAIE